MEASRFVRVRDRHLSLWQSVVSEVARAQLRSTGSSVSENDVLRHPMVGDWGTGLDDAVALLQDVMKHSPAAIIHLGDIYYSGTPTECQIRYADIFTSVFGATRIPVFSLAGNHDYYAFGYGFYETFNA